ncbi:unnamed protein product [Amoebophrya sp. A120]|nr:unnamed protein product [Amoebophrya sp. A120]|eukprot:GSA120T00002625001.1
MPPKMKVNIPPKGGAPGGKNTDGPGKAEVILGKRIDRGIKEFEEDAPGFGDADGRPEDLDGNPELKAAIEWLEALLNDPNKRFGKNEMAKVVYFLNRFYHVNYVARLCMEIILKVLQWPYCSRFVMQRLLTQLDLHLLMETFPKLIRVHGNRNQKMLGYTLAVMGCVADLDARHFTTMDKNGQLYFHVIQSAQNMYKSDAVMLNTLLFLQRLCAPSAVDFYLTRAQKAAMMKLSPARLGMPLRETETQQTTEVPENLDATANAGDSPTDRKRVQMLSSVGFADEMLTQYLVSTQTAGDIFLGKVQYYSYGKTEADYEAIGVRSGHQTQRFAAEKFVGKQLGAKYKVPRLPRSNVVSMMPGGRLPTPDVYTPTPLGSLSGAATPLSNTSRSSARTPLLSDVDELAEHSTSLAKAGRKTGASSATKGGKGAGPAPNKAAAGGGTNIIKAATAGLDPAGSSKEDSEILPPVSAKASLKKQGSSAKKVGKAKSFAKSRTSTSLEAALGSPEDEVEVPLVYDLDKDEAVPSEVERIQEDRERKAWLDTKQATLEYCDFYTRIRDCHLKNQVQLFSSGALEWLLTVLQQLAVPPIYHRAPKSVKTKEEKEEDAQRAAEKKAREEEARRLAEEEERKRLEAEEAARKAEEEKNKPPSSAGKRSRTPPSAGKAGGSSRGRGRSPPRSGSTVGKTLQASGSGGGLIEDGIDTTTGLPVDPAAAALPQADATAPEIADAAENAGEVTGLADQQENNSVSQDVTGTEQGQESKSISQSKSTERASTPSKQRTPPKTPPSRQKSRETSSRPGTPGTPAAGSAKDAVMAARRSATAGQLSDGIDGDITLQPVEEDETTLAAQQATEQQTIGTSPQRNAEEAKPASRPGSANAASGEEGKARPGSNASSRSSRGVRKAKTSPAELLTGAGEGGASKSGLFDEPADDDVAMQTITEEQTDPSKASGAAAAGPTLLQSDGAAAPGADEKDPAADDAPKQAVAAQPKRAAAGKKGKGGLSKKEQQALAEERKREAERKKQEELRQLRMQEMEKETREADVLLLATQALYLLIRENPHTLRRLCRSEVWEHGTSGDHEDGDNKKDDIGGVPVGLGGPSSSGPAAGGGPGGAPSGAEAGNAKTAGEQKKKKKKAAEPEPEAVDWRTLSPTELFERAKQKKLSQITQIDDIQKSAIATFAKLLRGRYAQDRVDIIILLLRVIKMCVEYWRKDAEVGPWLELLSPIQEALSWFCDNMAVQIEGAQVLSGIIGMSRQKNDHREFLGLRVPVLRNVTDRIKEGIENTKTILEVQQRMGSGEMSEVLQCFSPRLLHTAQKAKDACDQVMIEALEEKKRFDEKLRIQMEKAEAKRLKEEAEREAEEAERAAAEEAKQKKKKPQPADGEGGAAPEGGAEGGAAGEPGAAGEGDHGADGAGAAAGDSPAAAGADPAQQPPGEQQDTSAPAAPELQQAEPGPEAPFEGPAVGEDGAEPAELDEDGNPIVSEELNANAAYDRLDPVTQAKMALYNAGAFHGKLGDKDLVGPTQYGLFEPSIVKSLKALTELAGSDPLMRPKKQTAKSLKVKVYYRAGENEEVANFLNMFAGEGNRVRCQKLFAQAVNSQGYELPFHGLELGLKGVQYTPEQRELHDGSEAGSSFFSDDGEGRGALKRAKNYEAMMAQMEKRVAAGEAAARKEQLVGATIDDLDNLDEQLEASAEIRARLNSREGASLKKHRKSRGNEGVAEVEEDEGE